MKQPSLPPSKKSIDWNAVLQRLETVRAAIEQTALPDEQARKTILKARARRLAQKPVEQAPAKASLAIIEFVLAYEKYGLELPYLREVHPLKDLTPLPCTPPFVLGIINVRGRILSVIDLKKFFDLPEKGLTDLNKVIILHSAEMELGILADAITGVRTIPLADIQPPLPTLTGLRADYLRGVAKGQLAILDAARILADRRLVVQEEVEA